MQFGLPALPLFAVALAVGGVSGAAGTRFFPPADAPAAASEPGGSASAQAAIVDDDAPPPDAAERRIARAPDGLFYVHARVNGRRIRFLVDTGATVVVLRAADAAAIGAAPRDGYRGRMETAAGGAPMAWTRLASLSVAGREAHGVRAAVVRDGLGVSLLGQNMLSRLGAVRIEGDRLILR